MTKNTATETNTARLARIKKDGLGSKPAVKATPAKRTRTPRKPATPKSTTPAPAKTTAPKPAPANCACGCGAPTITSKAVFLSGHDARHAGVLGRALAVTPNDATLKAAYDRLSPRLQSKVDAIRVTATRKQAEKAARDAAKVAAKAAFDKAMATV